MAGKKRSGTVKASQRAVSDRVPITINLPKKDVELAKEYAAAMGVTMTEAFRQGIQKQEMLREIYNRGGKLAIEEKDKTVTKIVFWNF